MIYAYFPGCAAKGSGRSYEESLLAVFRALGTGLDEIKDWNCCAAAAAYPSVDMAKAFALSARNLVLAEDCQPGSEPVDAPCAGCYRAMLKTERALADGGGMADRVGGAFQAVGAAVRAPRPGAPSARRARERIGDGLAVRPAGGYAVCWALARCPQSNIGFRATERQRSQNQSPAGVCSPLRSTSSRAHHRW